MIGTPSESATSGFAPALVNCALIFATAAPGTIKSGESTSIKWVGGAKDWHSLNKSSNFQTTPLASLSSMHCRSSHMPLTFLRKQIFPPTPPRLVKFCARASSVTHGASSTVPTSDHVPELMNAQSFPVAGIAAIADAVSWQAGTITLVSCSADNSDKSPRRCPTVVPLATILGAAVRFNPVESKTSLLHRCTPTATNPECVAFVYSATTLPQSRYVMYSGKFTQGVASSFPASLSANNW